uniref:hypothetical protein n=1 Tax=Sulfuracidifex metallicus TaxID=47303 RepID=UPI001C44FDA1
FLVSVVCVLLFYLFLSDFLQQISLLSSSLHQTADYRAPAAYRSTLPSSYGPPGSPLRFLSSSYEQLALGELRFHYSSLFQLQQPYHKRALRLIYQLELQPGQASILKLGLCLAGVTE